MDIFELIQGADQILKLKEPEKKDLALKTLEAEILKAGASTFRNPLGQTPLIYAALHVRDEQMCAHVVQLLVKSWQTDQLVENANATDYEAGRTALHWAIATNNVAFYKAMQTYLRKAMWFTYRDYAGKSPYTMAREKQFQPLWSFIQVDRFSDEYNDTFAKLPAAKRPPMKLAVLGTGASGAGMFIRLVKRMLMTGKRYPSSYFQDVSVYLMDDKQHLGTGTPYSREKNSATCLLNIQAGGMSIDPDQSNDFVLWLKELELNGTLAQRLGIAAEHDVLLCPPSARIDGYYPRVLYGEYVEERLLSWVEKATAIGMKVIKLPTVTVKQSVPVMVDGLVQFDLTYGLTGGAATSDHTERFTHVFQSTGHWSKSVLPTSEAYVPFPANQDALRNKMRHYLLPKSGEKISVGIFGSALSSIDAIFSVLLDPAVGNLTWNGDEPTYNWKKNVEVACYSRRGLFPKVRPESNRDRKLRFMTPLFLANLAAKQGGTLSLDNDIIPCLNKDFQEALKDPHFNVIDASDPLVTNPQQWPSTWDYLANDIEQAENGDGTIFGQQYVRWYQVMHAVFPVIRQIYERFSPADRSKFDKDYNSMFLWAFAPMPLRSAKILHAMFKAGALFAFRAASPKPDYEAKPGKVQMAQWLDPTNQKSFVHTHDFMIHCAGLEANYLDDPSVFTQSQQAKGLLAFDMPGSGTAKMTGDGKFEILTVKGEHTPAYRGVGFFLHYQLFDVQSVPTAVGYGTQVAELYFDEYSHRYATPVPPVAKPPGK